jgi:hypothetical protein
MLGQLKVKNFKPFPIDRRFSGRYIFAQHFVGISNSFPVFQTAIFPQMGQENRLSYSHQLILFLPVRMKHFPGNSKNLIFSHIFFKKNSPYKTPNYPGISRRISRNLVCSLGMQFPGFQILDRDLNS